MFDFVVDQQVWILVAEIFNIDILSCFDRVMSFWHMHKENAVLNMVTTAALWSLWRLRNEFCFQGRKWRSVKCILAKLSCYLHQWKVLCDDGQATLLQRCILLLDKRRGELLRIAWRWCWERPTEKLGAGDDGSLLKIFLSFSFVSHFCWCSVISKRLRLCF